MPDHESQTMQCMEVWGGNALVNNSVSISGLDAWVYSKPYQSADAGGDVYYLSSCATGRITRLLVADVSGHGAKVKETAAVLRTLMRRFVNHLDQRQFVRSMNEHFTEMSNDGSFATAVVNTFFGPTNTLTLCNAGHPTPLLYRAKTKSWSLLERGSGESAGIANIPLGIEGMTEYESVGVELDLADLVICYSDSLIESHGTDGTMLGEEGLLAIATQIDVADPTQVVPNLLAKIQSLHAGNLEGDDVTVLMFRPTGSTRVGFFGRAFAPIRVLGASIMSLFPGHGPAPLPDFSLANLGGVLFGRLNRRWRVRGSG
jgi:serine phosphatase RsbU (regulator of sigma subunit)